jgi:hypothetical protein
MRISTSPDPSEGTSAPVFSFTHLDEVIGLP